MKRTRLKFISILTAALMFCMGAWGGVSLPAPIYTETFEDAEIYDTNKFQGTQDEAGTLVGSGEIVEGTDQFGKYYQNKPSSIGVRSNYLRIVTDAFQTSSIASNKAITISFWVNTAYHLGSSFTTTPGWNAMFEAFTDDGYTTNISTSEYIADVARAFDIRANTSSHAWFSNYQYHNTHNSDPAYVTNTSWMASGWHHIAYVLYDNEGATHLRFYIDGTLNTDVDLAQSGDGTLWANLTNLTSYVIGGCAAEWADNDVGFGYDDIAIYDNALTVDQVNLIRSNKLYERGTTNAWSASDVGSGAWSSGSVTAGLSDAGGNLSLSYNNASASSVLTLSPTPNAIVTMNATFVSGTACGRNDSYDYITMGGITLKAYTQNISTAISINGGEDINLELDGRNATYTIQFVVNPVLGKVTYSINNGEKFGTALSSTKVTGITIGHYKAGAEGYSASVTLKNISVKEKLQTVGKPAVPTASITAVDGVNRTVTFACETADVTLSYSTDGGVNFKTGTSLVISANTDIIIRASKADSHTDSETLSFEAGTEVTLNDPVFTVADMIKNGTDGFYYPKVTASCDNSDLVGAPTATLSSSEHTFTAAGETWTVTATCAGYTSSSKTFTVPYKYYHKKAIDFTALTASDFSDELWWTSSTGNLDERWYTNTDLTAASTYYKVRYLSDDCSNVIDGITISNGTERKPEVYIGFGLYTPYVFDAESYRMNFTVDDCVESEYIVYAGWSHYGSSTFKKVLAGNETYGLYRYDAIMKTINVYTPVLGTTIGKGDNTTAYLADMSDKQTLSPGSGYHYKFTNHNSGGSDKWKNWVLPVYNANDEKKLVIRGDRYEDVKNSYTGFTSDIDWSDFVNQMNGADVDLNVAYTSGNVLIVNCNMTTSDGLEWTFVYNSSDAGNTLTGDIKVALSVSESWVEISSTGQAAVADISNSGWATYSNSSPLDLSQISGGTAYVVTGKSSSSVALTECQSAVPANTGLLLMREGGGVVTIPLAASGSAPASNYLVATTESTSVPAGNYILGWDGTNLYTNGFYLVEAGSLPVLAAGKAYLSASAGARFLNFTFGDEDDDATGIDIVEAEGGEAAEAASDSGPVYNLAGQIVTDAYKGIVIKNGRKYWRR